MSLQDPSSRHNSFLNNVEPKLTPIQELDSEQRASGVDLMAKSKSHEMNSLTGGIGENTPGQMGGTKSFYGTPGGPMHAAPAAGGTPGGPQEGTYISRG